MPNFIDNSLNQAMNTLSDFIKNKNNLALMEQAIQELVSTFRKDRKVSNTK